VEGLNFAHAINKQPLLVSAKSRKENLQMGDLSLKMYFVLCGGSSKVLRVSLPVFSSFSLPLFAAAGFVC